MKTKFHEFQKNFILPTSKSSIIYLGIALGAFTNVALALNYQQASFTEETNQTSMLQSFKNFATASDGDHSRERVGTKENTAVTPEVIVFNPYEKTIEEVIAEDNLIIEDAILSEIDFSTEQTVTDENKSLDELLLAQVYPHYNVKTIEEIIAEDSKIIERPIMEAVQTKSGSGKCNKQRNIL